ncbi:MAG: metalloregulator ArsR/SmtB family transcription factor [Clostridiales bacterium]|nr:metalloregulator ArsR/SmtB family transcription factor [Clostridiales bacterium]
MKGRAIVSEDKIQDCKCEHNHLEFVDKVRHDMPAEEHLYDLADLFKVFGDTTRIKILYVLFESEMCVCDIADSLGMTQSAISHQLKVLKQSKLIGNKRDGKSIIYYLADDHVRTIIGMGMDHILE